MCLRPKRYETFKDLDLEECLGSRRLCLPCHRLEDPPDNFGKCCDCNSAFPKIKKMCLKKVFSMGLSSPPAPPVMIGLFTILLSAPVPLACLGQYSTRPPNTARILPIQFFNLIFYLFKELNGRGNFNIRRKKKFTQKGDTANFTYFAFLLGVRRLEIIKAI